MNWRKPVIHLLFRATGSKIPRYLKQIHEFEFADPEQVRRLADQKLEKLLLHAYENVPYYHRIFEQANIIRNGKVQFEHFTNIPILTKPILRHEVQNLHSRDTQTRSVYTNTSGGSTGEPVPFLQDRNYDQWNTAYKLYFNAMQGQELGQSQIKLWGSERDIFKGRQQFSERCKYWLFHITQLNSFRMSEEIMMRYVQEWNRIQPRLVWSYTSSIYELARFVEASGAEIIRPKVIICTAETLAEEVRNFVQRVMDCPVLNQYGSREVGVLACECQRQHGLHIFSLHNKVEILDDQLRPCPPGEIGGVYITTLNNYSMPLIRYQIGDTAALSAQDCPCGRTGPILETIAGRISGHFKTQTGNMIHGEYFTHLFYNKNNVKKFQVVQQDYDRILCRMVPIDSQQPIEVQDIEEKIKIVMGQDCRVEFEYPPDIETSPSGKYLYTQTLVK